MSTLQAGGDIFRAGVAAAGGERYLVCAAGTGWIVLMSFVPALLLWLQAAVDAIVCAQL